MSCAARSRPRAPTPPPRTPSLSPAVAPAAALLSPTVPRPPPPKPAILEKRSGCCQSSARPDAPPPAPSPPAPLLAGAAGPARGGEAVEPWTSRPVQPPLRPTRGSGQQIWVETPPAASHTAQEHAAPPLRCRQWPLRPAHRCRRQALELPRHPPQPHAPWPRLQGPLLPPPPLRLPGSTNPPPPAAKLRRARAASGSRRPPTPCLRMPSPWRHPRTAPPHPRVRGKPPAGVQRPSLWLPWRAWRHGAAEAPRR
mmetsp:Transcript_44589/g.147813  ORF Transcript_44589/g.147813 Transcript_44589/m.147813 type:complete len:254 (-) Transcript_44589:569-1330(-)